MTTKVDINQEKVVDNSKTTSKCKKKYHGKMTWLTIIQWETTKSVHLMDPCSPCFFVSSHVKRIRPYVCLSIRRKIHKRRIHPCNLTCLRRHAFCFVFNKSFFISISCIFSCSHYMDTMNFFGGKWMRLCRPCHESCATCFGVGALTNRYFCLSVSYRRWIVKTGSYWRVSFAVLFVLLISCLRDI